MAENTFTWLDTKEYPFKPQYFDTGKANMHYIEVGEGPTILFVHGTPSWSFDFRNVIKELSKSFRCIAIDHIGFGLSEKPKDYPYTLQSHFDNLSAFIRAKELQNIHLVLHDFGGPIGLNYALSKPQNILSICILNSWIGSSDGDPEFEKYKKILKSPLLPFLYLYFNFSAKFLLPQSFGKKKLESRLKKQYTKPFSSRSERYGTLGFAKSLLNGQQTFENQWQRRGLLAEKPFCFIWGMKDSFASPKYLKKFQEGFQNSKTIELPDAGHFPQEEEPQTVAGGIKEFIQSLQGPDN
jgi:pimeloyl-ACP methyl ester carboxylesterase